MAQCIEMDIKLIRAFIASPRGLEEERRTAHAVAQQVNDTVAREMGGRLELIGWEETLSGIGRPQGLINADMETCDLFIGAIWTKWGMRPALDGPLTSGFEEEFELSRARHGRTGSPLMCVFFKEIDLLHLQDPGDELKKVLAFQEKLQREKNFLYDTFTTPDAFADKVRAFLTTQTIKLLRGTSSTRDEKASEPQPQEPRMEPINGDAASASTTSDSMESKFLVSASETLNKEETLSPDAIARLRLIGATAGSAENDKILIGVHDANLLYQDRRSLAFSLREKRGLLETGLAELDHEIVPIWNWLAEVAAEQQDILAILTLIGENAQRVGALTAMRLLAKSIHFPGLPEMDLVEAWLAQSVPGRVRAAALRYLQDHGTTSHVASIEKEVARADKDTLTPALEAAIAIHLRNSEADAANYILSTSFETLDESLLALGLDGLNELGNEASGRGLDHRSAAVRARTIETLSARGVLGFDTVDRAKEDDAPLVRMAALQALERLGQAPSLEEARKIMVRPKYTSGLLFMSHSSDIVGEGFFARYLTERLRHMPLLAVESLLSSSPDRHAAYLALAARRAKDFGNELRSDLMDNFVGYASRHWPDGIKPANSFSSILFLGTLNPLDAKRRDLVRESLDIVADQRDEKDLPLLRHVLDSKFVSPSAAVVAFIRSLGGLDDVERLGCTSTPGSPMAFDDAARAILKILNGDLRSLTDRDLPDEMLARVVDLAPNAALERLPDLTILTMLLADKPQLRRAVAKKVPASLPRRRVRRLLQAYRADPEGRYYVVTHWLDLGLAYPRAIARRVALARGVS